MIHKRVKIRELSREKDDEIAIFMRSPILKVVVLIREKNITRKRISVFVRSC